jgi:hypothetical protein
MEHLTGEQLARLVDESPTDAEGKHLSDCEACRAELDGYRDLSSALGGMPEILPPKGDWRVLEAQLRSEGLVRDPSVIQRLGLARTPVWMKAAAAAVLFLSGAGTGLAIASPSGTGTAALMPASTIEDAALAVRAAEDGYVNAVSQYQALLSQNSEGGAGVDPASRLAALEYIVEASQAAVWQNPEDPFFNGFLTSAMAERNAVARMVSSNRDNWF